MNSDTENQLTRVVRESMNGQLRGMEAISRPPVVFTDEQKAMMARSEERKMRDTQFAGFAARLLQDLLDQCAYVAISEWATGGDSAKSEQLIAQRAYDLACHVASEITGQSGHADGIPDLTTWPEETSK